jgi:putative spermidine/putrescine transport system ATP-binding protein
MAPYVTLQNLSKAFGGNRVLDGFNLEIEKGEFISFLGPSGCGKTTALRLIAGLVPLDQGQISIGGRDITNMPANRRNTIMVFQSYALFPHMTVVGNIGFGLKMRNISKKETVEKINVIIEKTRLTGLEDRYPKELSGGQAQRVALARALVMNPDVLLLDEPLSNLDAKLRQEMRVEIRLLHESLGLTTIFVTHDQDEALTFSDRLVVMNDGKIVQYGKPREVFEKPKSYFVADFTSVKNFFPGSFSGSGNIFVSENGIHIQCASRDEKKNLVGVRPNKITVNPKNPETYHNMHKASVRLVTYRGNTIDILANVKGHEIVAEVPSLHYKFDELESGKEITLAWQDSDSLLLEQ